MILSTFRRLAAAFAVLVAAFSGVAASASSASAAVSQCNVIADYPSYASPYVSGFGTGRCNSAGTWDSIGITVRLTRDGVTVDTTEGGRCYGPGPITCEAPVQATNASGDQVWCTHARLYNYDTGATLATDQTCETSAWRQA